jgi:hypothetical protein
MRLDREVRRTLAQFLNGLAVAVIATMVMAPAVGEAVTGVVAVSAIIGAALLHLLALMMCSGR